MEVRLGASEREAARAASGGEIGRGLNDKRKTQLEIRQVKNCSTVRISLPNLENIFTRMYMKHGVVNADSDELTKADSHKENREIWGGRRACSAFGGHRQFTLRGRRPANKQTPDREACEA